MYIAGLMVAAVVSLLLLLVVMFMRCCLATGCGLQCNQRPADTASMSQEASS